MENNVQNIKFLRNGSLFDTRESALNGMQIQLNSLADGTAILGRYKGSGYTSNPNDVMTLVGYVFNDGTNKSLTIIDIEGARGDVESLRQEINAKLGDGISSSNTATAQLTALSGTSSDSSGVTSVWGAKAYTDDKIATLDAGPFTAGDGAFIKSVSQADGKVSATTADMPTVAVKTENGKPIIAVSQTKGTIAASAGTINAEFVNINDTAGIITATNVEGALAEIAAEIDAMDLAVVSGNGEVITAVSEEDGKVSASKTAIKDVKLTGYVKDTTKTGNIEATDDIEDVLSKLENKAAAITITNDDKSINVTTATSGTNINVNIKSGEKVIKKDGNNGIYTDLDLVKITTGLPAEIKERYQLLASDDSQIGTNIDIPKDSHIVSITYITNSGDTHYQNLEYVYIDASGNTKTEYVDISSLVLEAEFASGITVTNHVAHGVVDSTSEKDETNVAFLTVGADGFKISGIKDAIDTKINKLDADLSGNTTHVTVGVKEVDGKLTAVTVAEDNIANADDLASLSGKAVTEIASSNASISATSSSTADGTVKYDIVTDASKVKMTGFTPDNSGFTAITTSSTVTDAVKTIETIFIENEEIVSAALNDLEDRKAEKTDVQEKYNYLNDKIGELESGTSADLAAEIAARKAVDGISAQTYVANAGKKYISGATSLNDADIKLNDALVNIEDTFVGEVKVNGTTLAETDNAVNIKIAAGSTAASDNNAIHVDTAANGDVTLTLGTIDAGTY